MLMKFGMVTQIGPTGDRPLKFGIKKNKMAAAAILKNHKNLDITTTDRQIFAKSGMTMQNGTLNRTDSQKVEFPKSKMADGRHFENR